MLSSIVSRLASPTARCRACREMCTKGWKFVWTRISKWHETSRPPPPKKKKKTKKVTKQKKFGVERKMLIFFLPENESCWAAQKLCFWELGGGRRTHTTWWQHESQQGATENSTCLCPFSGKNVQHQIACKVRQGTKLAVKNHNCPVTTNIGCTSHLHANCLVQIYLPCCLRLNLGARFFFGQVSLWSPNFVLRLLALLHSRQKSTTPRGKLNELTWTITFTSMTFEAKETKNWCQDVSPKTCHVHHLV